MRFLYAWARFLHARRGSDTTIRHPPPPQPRARRTGCSNEQAPQGEEQLLWDAAELTQAQSWDWDAYYDQVRAPLTGGRATTGGTLRDGAAYIKSSQRPLHHSTHTLTTDAAYTAT